MFINLFDFVEISAHPAQTSRSDCVVLYVESYVRNLGFIGSGAKFCHPSEFSRALGQCFVSVFVLGLRRAVSFLHLPEIRRLQCHGTGTYAPWRNQEAM
jgi:hypothetical protein